MRDRPQGTDTAAAPKEPVGAVLRVGKKGPKGHPIDRDRFYIASPGELDGVRPEHPDFSWYNSATPDKRRSVRCNLVHAWIGDAMDHHRHCHKRPDGESPPNRWPWCVGDGRTAQRRKPPEWDPPEQIKCPGDLCPYAQQAACKPTFTLLFRPRWNREGAPAPLMIITSRGQWTSYPALLGLWRHVARVAHGLGLLPEAPGEAPEDGWRMLYDRRLDLFGMPFSISLEERTSQTQKTRFPTLRFAVDGDLEGFFLARLEHRRQLAEGADVLALPAASIRERDDAELEADILDITPGQPGEAGQGGLFE